MDRNQLPIHLAIKAGDIEVCKVLLEFGADYSSYLSGISPVVLAAEGDRCDIINLLVQFGRCLFIQSIFSTSLSIRFLSTSDVKGAQVYDTGEAGVPALVAAVRKGCISSAQLLIQLGADIKQADSAGISPLHAAVLFYSSNSCSRSGALVDASLGKDLLHLLLEAGADPHQADRSGESPLSFVQRHGQVDLLQLLEESQSQSPSDSSDPHLGFG